jgi:hypothetical protein
MSTCFLRFFNFFRVIVEKSGSFSNQNLPFFPFPLETGHSFGYNNPLHDMFVE